MGDKPASQPISVVIAEEGQDFDAVNEPVSTKSSVVEAASTSEAMEVTSASTSSQNVDHETMIKRGYRVTTTQPPLYFLPRSEDKIAQMRKRRNYELDSTTLPARFYSNRSRDRKKRAHHEMESHRYEGGNRFDGGRFEGDRFDRPPRFHDRRDAYYPRG